jgi:enoyl-[acyl-carrier-protein] reductase (NADH)
MHKLAEQSREIDLLTLKEELAAHAQLEQAGGSAYISSMIDGIPDVANVERYAKIVKEKSMLRRLIVMGNSVMRAALDTPNEPAEVLNIAEQSLYRIAEGSIDRGFVALDRITRKNMEMTLDVMANSLVYWAQDVWRAGLFADGSKIYAMTSEGSSRVIPSYGAVSAAKSALESNCRQLAMEFAKLHSGVTVNAIRAGVTKTPALMQLPEAQDLIDHALRRNPMGRLASVDDVASAIVAFSGEGTHWLTGNVLGVDGGELVTG